MTPTRHINGIRATAIAIATAVIAAAALPSCSSSGCSDNRSSLPLAGFYSYATHESISLDSLRVFGVGAPGDSLLMDSGQRASEVYLPLRPDREDVTFEIQYTETALAERGISDLITISYTSFPYFASEECGAMYRYRITSVAHTAMILDSVAVTAPDSVITNIDVESMQLFFRVSEE